MTRSVKLMALLGFLSLAATAATNDCHTACGNNAHCDRTKEYADCVCNTGFYGSGYAGCTATPECTADGDCKDNELCNRLNLCEGVCRMGCPADVSCTASNHRATCSSQGVGLGHPNTSSST